MIRLVWLFSTAFIFPVAHGLQALDEKELSNISGEGLGGIVEDLVIYSGNLGETNEFKLNLFLDTSREAGNYLRLSELRINKSGEEPGKSTSGGRFGTYQDFISFGQLADIRESYQSVHDPEGDGTTINDFRVHTALYNAFPASSVAQVERSFLKSSGANVASINGDNNHIEYPAGFFSGGNVNPGSFFAKAGAYSKKLDSFEKKLDAATDKFDFHLRVDSINDTNRGLGTDKQFLANLDIKGFRLYGTEAYIWAHSAQGEVNRKNYGLSLAVNAGLRAEEIVINSDVKGKIDGALSLKGVDIYLPLGTIDQPLSLNTVQFAQKPRGQWRNGTDLAKKTQLRLEIAELPQAVGSAKSGNIFIQQLNIGGKDNPEVITGKEDIFLRNASGAIVSTITDVEHRAFVPKTVIYNEQVALYNKQNVGNEIPFIPNENVIEIRDIQIQRLVITTQDL